MENKNEPSLCYTVSIFSEYSELHLVFQYIEKELPEIRGWYEHLYEVCYIFYMSINCE